MKKFATAIAIALAACAAPQKTAPVAASSAAASAEGETASEVPLDPRYVWDLTDIYESPAAWDAAREQVLKKVDAFGRHKGTLARGPEHLASVMAEMFEIDKEANRVYSYASMSNDEDQRVSETQSREQLARVMAQKAGQATAWVQPELLELGSRKIEAFIAKNKELAPYAFFLRDTVRLEPHTLDPEGEQLLASAGLVLSAPAQIYSMLVNADVPWPTITLSDGTKAYLDSAGYTRYRSVANRDDRKKVFDTFWGKWKEFSDSIGATLNTEVQSNVFTARARKYGSALEAFVARDNVPTTVYRTLIAETNAALPTLHRYFGLRARLLGVDDLGYFDLYPPLVELGSGSTFDIERSKEISLLALEPFGQDYIEKLKYAFSQKWMHGQPRKGKRSGAYMNGSVYDVHPYILLNHNDDYEALSTFAHEWGHAVHSLLANESQPYPTA
ncbi:MAG: M3 family oligoendopeptidase, partial [Myxococcota bacterium]